MFPSIFPRGIFQEKSRGLYAPDNSRPETAVQSTAFDLSSSRATTNANVYVSIFPKLYWSLKLVTFSSSNHANVTYCVSIENGVTRSSFSYFSNFLRARAVASFPFFPPFLCYKGEHCSSLSFSILFSFVLFLSISSCLKGPTLSKSYPPQ